MSFVLNAPAKINWFLSVLDRRTDGYHNISTLMQCVELFDELAFADHEEIDVICDIPDLAAEKNLVYRAAQLLKDVTGINKGARITLKKEIPLAAGLGGGSSDAAYAMIGLNRLWDLGLSSLNLQELGARIGSDVPFFIDNIYAVVQGRGEIIRPVTGAGRFNLLLVNPGIAVSAEWAYKSLQIRLTKKPVDIKLFCQSLDREDFDLLRSMLVNDLESAVINRYPVIGRIKETLYEYGASAAAMSGSGSTVFGLFRTEDDTIEASGHMGPFWCRAVKTLAV